LATVLHARRNIYSRWLPPATGQFHLRSLCIQCSSDKIDAACCGPALECLIGILNSAAFRYCALLSAVSGHRRAKYYSPASALISGVPVAGCNPPWWVARQPWEYQTNQKISQIISMKAELKNFKREPNKTYK
jgi:hypothetical protein